MDETTAITQLLNRYCHFADQGLIEDVLELFADDSKLIVRALEEQIHEGKEAVRGWYENWKQTTWAASSFMQHRVLCPVIEITGTKATSNSYLFAPGVNKESNHVTHLVGHYEDILTKESGNWLFAERAIVVDLLYDTGVHPLFFGQ